MEQQNEEATPTPSSVGARAGHKVRNLVVHVTQEIIETALPANSGHCMISDAVKEAAAGRRWRISKVLTDLQTIRFTDLKKQIRYICFTPRIGQLALLAFDQGKQPEPFMFRLRPVQIIPRVPRNKGKKSRTARVVTAIRKSGVTAERPIKHGGHAIPTTVGLRREFGLRGMGVYSPPSPPTEPVAA